ncbi:uncharacterized protein DMAD_06765 [Drosophila madeirensis]|uniref:Bestrophin homolog n=1 Tax=Drosophila madeirensis TaxID=30013 RepID=A0AAU9FT65_DROMD
MHSLSRMLRLVSGWIRRHQVLLVLLHFLILAATIVVDYKLTIDLSYWRKRVTTLLTEEPTNLLPMLMATKLTGLLYMAFRYLLIHEWVIGVLERRERRRFANFIVRRLVMQLDQASERLPKSGKLSDPLTQQSYVEARTAQYRAIDLFRRDANALLVQRNPTDVDPHFFVLPEEEELLARAGYSSIDLKVTEHVLQDLITPLDVGSIKRPWKQKF